MIGLSAGTRIWVAAGVTDMRSGFNGLAARVQTTLSAGGDQRERVAAVMRIFNLSYPAKHVATTASIRWSSARISGAVTGALRGVAIGRRNYMFVGADKLNGYRHRGLVAPCATHIADHPDNRVNEFLSWNFAPGQLALA